MSKSHMDVMLESKQFWSLCWIFFSCRIPLSHKLPGIFDYFVYFLLKKIPRYKSQLKSLLYFISTVKNKSKVFRLK